MYGDAYGTNTWHQRVAEWRGVVVNGRRNDERNDAQNPKTLQNIHRNKLEEHHKLKLQPIHHNETAQETAGQP